jgi:hypothetical protein
MLLSISITKVRNNAWEEKRDGILTAIGTKVDEDEDIKFGVFERFQNILVLESDFLIR